MVTIDTNGRILEFNPAAEVTFGYSKNEVLGEEMALLEALEDRRARYGSCCRAGKISAPGSSSCTAALE